MRHNCAVILTNEPTQNTKSPMEMQMPSDLKMRTDHQVSSVSRYAEQLQNQLRLRLQLQLFQLHFPQTPRITSFK